jgi:hypothetical protein
VIGTVNRTGTAYDVIEVLKQDEGVVLRDTPRFSSGERELRVAADRKVEHYPLVMASVATMIFSKPVGGDRPADAGISVVGAITLLIGSHLVHLRQRSQHGGNGKSEVAEAANLAKSSFRHHEL